MEPATAPASLDENLQKLFAGANPMPDLRHGGPALIDALIAALAMEKVPA